MQKKIQLWSAIGMLIAGTALTVAGFCVPPVGEIHNSVLMFAAQCLIYAGSALGLNIYIDGKLQKMMTQHK